MSEPFLRSLFSPEGKVAVVTGGSGMLGAPMAKGLAQASARVAILAWRIEPATATVAAIKMAGRTALVLSADVYERAQVERACATIVDRWGTGRYPDQCRAAICQARCWRLKLHCSISIPRRFAPSSIRT